MVANVFGQIFVSLGMVLLLKSISTASKEKCFEELLHVIERLPEDIQLLANDGRLDTETKHEADNFCDTDILSVLNFVISHKIGEKTSNSSLILVKTLEICASKIHFAAPIQIRISITILQIQVGMNVIYYLYLRIVQIDNFEFEAGNSL